MNEAEPNGTGPGLLLKRARKARDMTQQDVSDSLNLMVRVIDDIESERWTQLPPPTFSRGYLRAYAKLLGIDPDAIVKVFDAAVGHAGSGQDAVRMNAMLPAKGGVAELMQKQPGTVLTGAVALVICGVVVVLWAVWPDVSGKLDAQKKGATTPPANALTEVIPKTESAAKAIPDAAIDKGAAQPAVALAAPPHAAPTDSKAPATAQANAAPAPTAHGAVEQAAKHAAEPGGGPRRITDGGDDRLAFAFTQDCWVEVKDKQGRSIYSDLSKSGDSLELIGQAPFMIMLGYAPGVVLSFNGERVTLTPHTRNNVATLALGQ